MHISENMCKYSNNPTAQAQRERLQSSRPESGLIKMSLTITKMQVGLHLVGGGWVALQYFFILTVFGGFSVIIRFFWFFLTFSTNFLKIFKSFWSYNAEGVSEQSIPYPTS